MIDTLVQIAVDAVSLGGLFALTALGIGLIFGIMRLINFAHGDLITLGAYALIVPSTAIDATMYIGAWPAVAIIVAVSAIVVVLAVICERLAFRPLRNAEPSVLLIASFALRFFLQNAIIMVYCARHKGGKPWA